LELKYKDDPVNRAFSTPLLTNYSSKGCSKDGNRATTPQDTKTATLNPSPNIFNKVIPMEISQEGKLKEGNYQNITSKYLLAFVNALKSTNKLVILYYPTPSPISEQGAASGEQIINFSVLQSPI
jgi:hypothetical protein